MLDYASDKKLWNPRKPGVSGSWFSLCVVGLVVEFAVRIC